MSRRPVSNFLKAVGVGILLLLGAPTAQADDVRPIQILVRELPSGDYDIKWSVPKVIPPQSMPSPRLPDGSRPVGERTFTDQPSAWLTRQVFHCPGGLAGRPLGIDFPFYNIGLSTLISVEFLSGDRYAHLLNPGEDTWLIPEAHGEDFSRRLEEARLVQQGGLRHFFGGLVHLLFFLMICLLGDARARVRLVTAFFLGQVGAVVFSSLSGVRLDGFLADAGVALATVILAREALRPVESRTQLALLAACAGAAHGLGIGAFASLSGQVGESHVYTGLLFAMGMDFALLASVTVVTGIGRLVRKRASLLPLARVTIYGVAGISLAFAAGAVVNGAAPESPQANRRLELPSMMAQGVSTGGVPRSQRVASNASDASLQSFVAVEAFEVRHEILVRLDNIAPLVGAGSGPELAVDFQDDVKEQIRDLVFSRVSLKIDGERLEPISQRVDFVTLDEKGVLPRPAPVTEYVETAWVGVTAVYLPKSMPRDLALTWEFIGPAAEIPTTVTDPEFSNTTNLTPSEPVFHWKNELAENPIPEVSPTMVEPILHTLHLWSLVPLGGALIFAGAAVRRRRRLFSLAMARVMLVLAIVLGPFGNLAVALPWTAYATPGTGEARRILTRILPNVYRALEFREESIVFDRLALSVTGETLSEVYLDHRKVLEMEERGGARARVEAVEVIEVDSVEGAGSGGFSAKAAWTVGGTVTHFGHRHFRQNRYDARLTVVPDHGNWKLQSIEILDEKRIR